MDADDMDAGDMDTGGMNASDIKLTRDDLLYILQRQQNPQK